MEAGDHDALIGWTEFHQRWDGSGMCYASIAERIQRSDGLELPHSNDHRSGSAGKYFVAPTRCLIVANFGTRDAPINRDSACIPTRAASHQFARHGKRLANCADDHRRSAGRHGLTAPWANGKEEKNSRHDGPQTHCRVFLALAVEERIGGRILCREAEIRLG